MRHMIVFFLLALFAVTCFTQITGIDPQNTIVTYPVQMTAGVGAQIYFQLRSPTNQTITLPSCSGVTSPFTIKVLSGPANYKTVTYTESNCLPNRNNTFSLGINTQTAGTYTLQAFYNQNTPIASSVQKVNTVPNVMSAQFSKMSGAGLSDALVGVNTTFNIQAVDQYGNTITNCSNINTNSFLIELIQTTVFETVVGVLGPCTNGHFTPTYVLNLTGTWALIVKYQSLSLNNSQPFVVARPGPPVAANCNVTGPGMIGSEAGVGTWFSFICHDTYGNLITYCTANYTDLWTAQFQSITTISNVFYAALNSCDDKTGLLNYTYNTQKAGNYTSKVYFNGNQNNQLPPFYPVITPGPADPSQTIATGNGVSDTQQNVAGQVITFQIDESDQYQNPIPGCISANWNILILPTSGLIQNASYPNCTGTHLTSTYIAKTTGDYSINIELNGTSINNGNLYNSVVYSNLLVPATATAKFPSSMVAGASVPFSISGYDTYGNEFDNCFLYPNLNSFSGWKVTLVNTANGAIVGSGSVNSCNNVSNTLTGTYTATATGVYNLTISYNGVYININNPLITVNSAALSPAFSIANGEGFGSKYNASQNAGASSSFNIVQYDIYGNLIDECKALTLVWIAQFTLSDNTKTINFTSGFSDCTAGTYTLDFSLTLVGSYFIKVGTYYQSATFQQINNTNGLVNIVPAAYDPFNPLTVVSASTNFSVGETFLVSTSTYDVYNNSINQNRNLPFTFTAVSPNATLAGNMTYLSGNTYQGSFVPIIADTYLVTVYYNKTTIVGTAFSVAFYGEFSATSSYANGTAFFQDVVAGTNGYFYVYTYNNYGFPIPASVVDTDLFVVDFINNNNVYNDIHYTVDNEQYLNVVAFTFNATIALNYQVAITYNSSLLNGSYFTNVIAAALDPNTLVVTGLNATSNGTGDFYVTGTDAFGNSVDVGNNFLVYFEPLCSNSNINCSNDPSSDSLYCTYDALFAGTYCVEIYYTPERSYYAVNASTVVVGGTACPDNCNNQGYCFPEGSADTVQNQTSGNCFCFQGYTGDDCSVKISKKYWNLWLGVGLIVGIPIILAIIGFVVGCLIGRR